jgi:hypothetical protein
VANDPNAVRTPARAVPLAGGGVQPPVFRPKSADDYLATVAGQQQRRSRRHEALIAAFGVAVKTAGLIPATNVHPRDLVITGQNGEWLVEAKVVGRNAELAVREAIGQLFSYRHFYYRKHGVEDPHLLALFTDDVGDGLLELLESLDIAVVWRTAEGWQLSRIARTRSPFRPGLLLGLTSLVAGRACRCTTQDSRAGS